MDPKSPETATIQRTNYVQQKIQTTFNLGKKNQQQQDESFFINRMAKLTQMAPPFPALALMPRWFGGKVQKVVLDNVLIDC